MRKSMTSRFAAPALIAALPLASVAACWPLDYSENDSVIFSSSAASTGSGGGGGGGGEGGGAPVVDWFVNPLNGADDGPGTYEQPFKTLKKALSAAGDGQTVHLFSGTYGAANGDDFKAAVPDGVTVSAVVPGDAVLEGTGTGTALHFRGRGRAEGLRIQGFLMGIAAMRGDVTLVELELKSNAIAVAASGTAEVTLQNSSIAEGGTALVLDSEAALTMTGGEISAIDARVVAMGDQASVTLDHVELHDSGGCVLVSGSSSAAIRSSTLVGLGTGAGCTASVAVYDAASLTVELTTIDDSSSQGSVSTAIAGESGTTMNVVAASITAASFGIYTDGSLSVEGSSLTGLDGAICGIFVDNHGSLVVGDSTISDFAMGVDVDGFARTRSTQISWNTVGVRVAGTLDMGTAAELGANILQNNSDTGLLVISSDPMVIHQAVGNTWIPFNQGTDGGGQFPPGPTHVGPFGDSDPAPRNVVISEVGVKAQLGDIIGP